MVEEISCNPSIYAQYTKAIDSFSPQQDAESSFLPILTAGIWESRNGNYDDQAYTCQDIKVSLKDTG